MPILRIDGDARGAVQAIGDLDTAVKKTGKTFDHTAAEAKKLEKAAAKIVEANDGPLGRYNARISELGKLVQTGKLSMEQAGVAAQRYHRELDRASKSNLAAFGEGAIEQIASYGKGLLSLTTLVGGVSQAFRQLEYDAQKAADEAFNSLGAMGQLQQVGTSKEDYFKLLGQARGMVSDGIFPSNQIGSAADVVFALRNAGYSDAEVDEIKGLGSSRMVKGQDLVKVAEGLKKYQNIFGQREAGDIHQVIQKVFSASGTMQTDFAEAANAATLFGSEAAALKFSDEEALAAFVAIEQRSPGAEEAATRLRSMLTQITRHGLSKGTLGNTIGDLVNRVRKGESAIEILDETRAAAGLNILAEEGGYQTYVKQVGEIAAAQNKDLVGGRNFLKNDPRLRAVDLRQRYTSQREAADDRLFTERESLFDALKETQLKRLEGDPIGRAFTRFMHTLIDVGNNERQAFSTAVRTGGYPEDLTAAMADYLERTARGVEELNEKMERNTQNVQQMNGKTRSAPAPSGRQEK